MNLLKKGKLSHYILVGIILISTLFTINIRWHGDSWKYIVASDAKGYYAYLPAFFIYDDPNFSFYEEVEKGKYYVKETDFDYRSFINEKDIINKYYCGTALLESPFFLIAHTYDGLNNGNQDGYSKIYYLLISVSGLFYFLIGLIFCRLILLHYKLSELNTSIVLIAIAFGTHLFHYSTTEPGMSHVYSFAMASIFIYYSLRYFELKKFNHFIFLCLSLALIILIRPVNILIVFSCFFLAGDFKTLKDSIFEILKNGRKLISVFLIFLVVLGLQFIYYKKATGNWFVYSYGEEGFNFLNPYFFSILFSFKKGLFLYTPLLFVSLFGLYFIYKDSPYKALTWVAFFSFITYIFSSWWSWYYGGSFSGRVYVEYIPFFAILLGHLMHHLNSKKSKTLFYCLIFLIISICQIQTFQYRYGQIHWEDMTKEKYLNTFLRIDKLM